jgi:mRNA-degrading endonuclease RelE of RelBE toxin-antitoxin system
VPAIIEFVYGDLAKSPRRVGKPLQRELEGLWSARRGPYRILYEIIDARLVVLIVNVDHRADIYRPR